MSIDGKERERKPSEVKSTLLRVAAATGVDQLPPWFVDLVTNTVPAALSPKPEQKLVQATYIVLPARAKSAPWLRQPAFMPAPRVDRTVGAEKAKPSETPFRSRENTTSRSFAPPWGVQAT